MSATQAASGTTPAGGSSTPSTPTSSASGFTPRRLVPGIVPASIIGGLALTSGVALTAASGWLIVAASFGPQILTLMAVIVAVRAFGIARPVLRYVERVKSHDAALGALAQDRGVVYDRLVPLTPARLGRRGRHRVGDRPGRRDR